MAKYEVEWTSLDPGGEGQWQPLVWLGALKIIGNHEGEGIYDAAAPVYDELQAAFPQITWKSMEGANFRPLFRDFPHAWTRTGVLVPPDQSDRRFQLTPIGREVVNGSISPEDLFIRLFRQYTEGGVKPFQVLAAGFLGAGRSLTLAEAYFGLMKEYRPGSDDLATALLTAAGSGAVPGTRGPRVLKLMLKLMERTGALASGRRGQDDAWLAWDTELLSEIALADVSTSIDDDTTLTNMVSEAVTAMHGAGLAYTDKLVSRFAASLLAKPFVILTGLTGSGKTKLAQAFAGWISPNSRASNPFVAGTVINGPRTSYTVVSADIVGVQLQNPDGTLTLLPRDLIDEYVQKIRERGLSRESVRVEDLRDAVASETRFSLQQNSFATQLTTAAFAQIAAQNEQIIAQCYEVIPVGADWTSKESVIGYANALNDHEYVTTQALELIRRASNAQDIPHFLILDEMNLSHVERYFADFLSAIESGEAISLYSAATPDDPASWRHGVRPSMTLPPNLFVIGTVNVDETTYMFSPKVLDRANVIEFRVAPNEMATFLDDPRATSLARISGAGSKFAKAFAKTALANDALPETEQLQLKSEMMLWFDVLALFGSEFGFRTAKEVARFISAHRLLSQTGWTLQEALDAQVYQKILPKLQGSRQKLTPVLCALAILCYRSRTWDMAVIPLLMTNRDALFEEAAKAGKDKISDAFLLESDFPLANAYYMQSFAKIVSMLQRLDRDGFAGFAEA